MRVGEYELLDGIGRGGTAEVFRARAADGRVVAVKVFSNRAGNDASVARFEREVRLTQALGEAEGFVRALDDGDSPFGSYLVMPLLDGSLRDRLRRGALPIDEALALGRQVSSALARAHASGVVHRDIKPENLLFDASGRWFVADLGLAKHFRADAPGAVMSQVLTRTGEGCGTVGYLAPEQLENAKSVGPPVDVFALGSVLYECLAGRPAFEGRSPLEVLARLSSGRVPALRAERPDAPAWLVRVVEQSLATRPERRYSDGGALAQALAGPGPARGVAWPVLAAAIGAVALLIGVAVSLALAPSATDTEATTSGSADERRGPIRDALCRARLGLSPPVASLDTTIRELEARAPTLARDERLRAERDLCLMRAERALAAGDAALAQRALEPIEPGDPERRLLAAWCDLAAGRAAAALEQFVALTPPGEDGGSLELAVGAARAALAAGRLDDARARVAALASRRGADARLVAERLGWLLRGADAAAALRGGDDFAALGLLDPGTRAPAAIALELRRGLALAAIERVPPSDSVLIALLRVEPDVLVDRRFAPWLLRRADARQGDDVLGAVRAIELALRCEPDSALPVDLELVVAGAAAAALFERRLDAWLDLTTAGLRAGVSHGLFPDGIERSFPDGGLLGELERRLAARPDDWGTALYLSFTLLRTSFSQGTSKRPPDHARGIVLANRVLAAPDLSPHGRAFGHEALGQHLLALERYEDGRAALEASMAAWHPRPDELAQDLSREAREEDRMQEALTWAERAYALRERRVERRPEDGRPRGIPLASLEQLIDINRARIDVRVLVFDRLLRVGELERAEQMISEIGAVPEGMLDARLAAAAHAFANGLKAEALERVRAVRADPQLSESFVRDHAHWLPDLIGDLPGGGRKLKEQLRQELGIPEDD